jgi:hypothetical protein
VTWTYKLGDLATPGSISEVRLKIGDTIAADPLLQDEEIAYFQTIEQSLELVCAMCCEAVAALYSRLADSTDGSISQSMSQKSAQYRERATELRRQAPITLGFGGISQSAKDALDADNDAVQPLFKKGGDDNPGTPSATRTLQGIDPFFEGF